MIKINYFGDNVAYISGFTKPYFFNCDVFCKKIIYKSGYFRNFRTKFLLESSFTINNQKHSTFKEKDRLNYFNGFAYPRTVIYCDKNKLYK
jgi:hypothetical protein